MIIVVDYGMGNLHSVLKGLQRVGGRARISDSAEAIRAADKLVVPGVGAMPAAVNRLKEKGLWPVLNEYLKTDRPFLGICLGMQILMEHSEEAGGCEGLGAIQGSVVRLAAGSDHPVPHMGWNRVEQITPDNPLFAGIPKGTPFYFCHSYAVAPKNEADAAAWTRHGGMFCSALRRGRIHAVQFHPEKSQRWGLALLHNFIAL